MNTDLTEMSSYPMLTASVTQTSDPVVMAEIRAALIHIHYVPEEELPDTDAALFQEWVTRVVDNAGDNEHDILGVENL